jgi:hypothetical protein
MGSRKVDGFLRKAVKPLQVFACSLDHQKNQKTFNHLSHEKANH